MNALELLGYAGSVLIAVSLMMTSVLRLRVINLVGAAVFSLYGVLIGAVPVAVLNGFIVLVNIWHVTRLLRTKELLQLLVLRPDSDYMRNFLNFYRADIRRVLPDFEYAPREGQLTLFILRDCNPVGVFIADEEAAGVLRVRLDFVVPRYRDLKIGRFIFCERDYFFRDRGVREIVITPRTADFRRYLQKIGFEPADGGALRLRYGRSSTPHSADK
jgi:hypothetical protein